MQAKLFRTSPTKEQWTQLDDSVSTALKKNPSLTRLTICLPQNLDDPRIEGQKSAMDRWKELKRKWIAAAKQKGMAVEFCLWDDTELTSRLTKPENAGRLRYFFDRHSFTNDWFAGRAREARANAGPRYSSELNVQLPIAEVFEGLRRTEAFAKRPRKLFGSLKRALLTLQSQNFSEEFLEEGLSVIQQAESLTSLLYRCEFHAVTKLPLDELVSNARATSEQAWKLYIAIMHWDREEEAKRKKEHEATGKPDYMFTYSSARSTIKETLLKISSIADSAAEVGSSSAARSGNEALLLVSGKAGMGKTHLFVDVALQCVKQGQPAVLLLGQQFIQGDPWQQILTQLNIGMDRDDFLRVLEAAGEAAGCRALILIDAINEGDGLKIWPNHLSGMIETLKSHPYIALGLSVRTTYEDAVLPESTASVAERVVHDGFASRPEQAVRAFFKFYNLNLPNIPLLNPEFNDPLFLTSLCKGLSQEGLHDIPSGYSGISKIFGLLVRSASAKLTKENKLDEPPGKSYIRDFLDLVAQEMAEHDVSSVTLTRAFDLSQNVKRIDGFKDSLLNLLILEGLLIKELDWHRKDSEPLEIVSFAYQKLGDHEVARHLLEKFYDPDNPSAVFMSEGQIGRLFVDSRGYYFKKGLLEALSVQVPERFGFELIDQFGLNVKYDELTTESMALSDCLVESLMWRTPGSITDSTFDALRRIRWSLQVEENYLSTLTMLSGIPDHPLNANRLHRTLSSYKMPQRDTWWTVWLSRGHVEGHAAERFISWAMHSDDKSHLTDDSVLLVATALGWFLTSTNHQVRDSATKALVQMLTTRIHMLPQLLDRFANVDDMYIHERLYAAVYGISLRTSKGAPLAFIACTVYERLFSKEQVIANLLVRDYGSSAIERAVLFGCELPFDLARTRPPYGSTLPARILSKKTLLAKKPPVQGKYSNMDRLLSHVVDRFGSLRIEEYAGGPPSRGVKFTSAKLIQERPLTSDEIRERFESQLSDDQLKSWKDLEDSIWTVKYRTFTPEDFDLDFGEEIRSADPEVFDLFIKRLLQKDIRADKNAFKESLSSDALRSDAERILKTKSRGRRDDIKQFDLDYIPRFISTRALQLGWSLKRFGDHDGLIEHLRSYSYSSEYTKQETIGAKYLWIAYWEVLAILTDNFYVASYNGAFQYQGSWQLSSVRNIDPSFVPILEGFSDEAQTWWTPRISDAEPSLSGEEWVRSVEGLPNLQKQLIIQDPDGIDWVILTSYPRWEEEAPPEEEKYNIPRRDIWIHLKAHLVKSDDASEVIRWAREGQMNKNDVRGGDGHNSEVFLGEFFRSPIWIDRQSQENWGLEEWHTPTGCPAPLAYLCEGYHQTSPDASTRDSVSAKVPSSFLVREGGLTWSGIHGNWNDEAGNTVVKDPSLEFGGKSVLMARKDFVERVLGQGYCLVWTVMGEKRYIGGGHNPHGTWQEFSDFAVYSNGDIDTEMKSTYRPIEES